MKWDNLSHIDSCAIVVQGAFLVGDSIAMDAILQYRILCEVFGPDRVCIIAETYSTKIYPGVDFTPYDQLDNWMAENPAAVVIYHFCDGWRAFEERLLAYGGRKIVRWHNNTPPWFYVENLPALRGTLRGLKCIIELVRDHQVEVWANSEFSVRQLQILIGRRKYFHCVFPASAYLETSEKKKFFRRRSAHKREDEPLRLLFVSRVVAHKGHKHVIAVADLIARARHRKVRVDFVGRRDENAFEYNALLESLRERARCEVIFHGGLPQAELDSFYDLADVFVCLSEHEGFGLPAFEAMGRDVPVVAWANTAYQDLLSESPLAFPEFDLANFAAAVEIAATPRYKKRIAEIQETIVGKYNRAVIAAQIVSGLEFIGKVALNKPASRKDISKGAAALAAAISSLSDVYRLYEESATGFNTEHDFTGNYISAYDVEAYGHLFTAKASTQRLFDFLNVGDQQAPACVRIAPAAFISKVAIREDDVFRYPAMTIEEGHLFYGPYLNMPAGRFGFRFKLAFSHYKADRPLRLEVVLQGRVVATREVTFGHDNFEGYLETEFLEPQADVEFRASVNGPTELSGAFGGVLIERLPDIASLVPVKQAASLARPDVQAAEAATLRLRASSFRTAHGRFDDDRLEIKVDKSDGQHLFFGPYLEIPKGRYRFTFELDISPPTGPFYLEIADEGAQIMREEVEFGDGRIVLEKEIDRRIRRGEFRLCLEAGTPVRVTLHGLEITRLPSLATLLIEGKIYTPQGVKIVAGEPKSVFFEPKHFVSRFAVVESDRLTFPAQIVPKFDQLIYGPYVAVPSGRFRIKFHFDFIRFETTEPVEIDVADEGRLICYRRLAAERLNEGPTIDCEFLAPVKRCEFRLSTRGEASVLGHFKGVSIERLPALAELEPAANLRRASKQMGRARREGALANLWRRLKMSSASVQPTK